MKKISLCIPNYTRTNYIIESFNNIINDDRIDEIVINDDCSPNFEEALILLNNLKSDKIKIFRNEQNLGPLFNKLETIKKATNEFCILLDSDNVISKEYLDIVFSQEWLRNKIICPEFLMHHDENIWNQKDVFISYSDFINAKIDFEYVKSCILNGRNIETLLNTGNFFVNKEMYVNSFNNNTFDRSVDVCDVCFFSYLFLLFDKENYLEIVKDLKYIHRVHNGSFYLNNAHNGETQLRILRENFLK